MTKSVKFGVTNIHMCECEYSSTHNLPGCWGSSYTSAEHRGEWEYHQWDTTHCARPCMSVPWPISFASSFSSSVSSQTASFIKSGERRAVITLHVASITSPLMYLPTPSPVPNSQHYHSVWNEKRVMASWSLMGAWGKVELLKKTGWSEIFSPIWWKVSRVTWRSWWNRSAWRVLYLSRGINSMRDGPWGCW